MDTDSENSEASHTSSPEEAAKRKVQRKKRKHDGDDDDAEVLPSASKSKSKNELYKQPTAEELNHLKETENLFNSNIFRLQIDELLAEIKVKPKHESQFSTWFETFKASFNTLPELELGFRQVKKNVGDWNLLNFDRMDKELFKKHKFKFTPPTSVFAFGNGGFVPNTDLKYKANIAVVMPKSLFYAKDYLNYKYTAKKLAYTSYLKRNFEKSDAVKSVSLSFYLGNKWWPSLEVTPSYSDKVSVTVYAVPEAGTFTPGRFLPDKNNVKKHVLTCDYSDEELNEFQSKGTPLYNATLLQDFTLEANWKLAELTLNGLSNVLDALKLLTVWLQQRNLNSGYAAFTNDLLINLLVYLALKKRINKYMSSYQVVRISWTFLSTMQHGNVLSVSEEIKRSRSDLFCKESRNKIILLDASGCQNMAAFLDDDIFKAVKAEAATAIVNLDNNRFDSFSALFTTKMPLALQYDAILSIDDDKNFKCMDAKCTVEEKFRFYGYEELQMHDYISRLLKKGLGRRASAIVPTNIGGSNVDFGITLDGEHCSKVIEAGPKHFDEGAQEFRDFWGKHAELRRFKDSSIYEAVYFEDAETAQSKRLIFRWIVNFIMTEKAQLKYRLRGDELEHALSLENIVPPFPTGSNEEATKRLKAAHGDLNTKLRELKLPLSITAVQGISDVFSYTDLCPPLSTNCKAPSSNGMKEKEYVLLKDGLGKIPRYIAPIESVIQLALHSKWPKELPALRAMKQMFMFEAGKRLKEQHNLKSAVYENYFDVFYEGYVFRFYLYHPKEIALVKKDVDEMGVTYYKDNEESLELESRLDVLPKICGALYGVHAQFPSYGPSTCLIKRWVRSHFLDDFHVPDIVINLLSASLFLHPDPFYSATLPQVAFLRFLKFMAEYDFKFRPVIVNFNDELESDKLNEIETKFLQSRSNFSPLYIITPYDNGTSAFTKYSPTVEILRRMKVLAAASYKYMLDSLNGMSPLKFKPLFIPNLQGFDLLIRVEPLMNSRRYERIFSIDETIIQHSEYDPSSDHRMPVVGFNPVEQYLKELRENYSEYALFFHDLHGGDVIGVLWKEDKAGQEVDFKVSTANARKYDAASGCLKLNRDAIIEDFYTLGAGLVKNIEVQTNAKN